MSKGISQRGLAIGFLVLTGLALALALAVVMLPKSYSVIPPEVLTLASVSVAHLFIEMLAVAIGLLVFSLSWHMYEKNPTRTQDSIGLPMQFFLVVAACDLSVAIFSNGLLSGSASASASAAFFWFIGRMVGALILFCMAVGYKTRVTRGVGLSASAASVVVVSFLGVYGMRFVPAPYSSLSGISGPRAIMDVALFFCYVAVAYSFWIRAKSTEDKTYYLLSASSIFLGLCELIFAVSTSIFDVQSIVAHCYKAVSYSLLYAAVFMNKVTIPFAEAHRTASKLLESEERIRSLSNNLPNSMVYRIEKKAGGRPRFEYVSIGVTQLYGISVGDALRDPSLIYQQFDLNDRLRLEQAKADSAQSMQNISMTLKLKNLNGETRWVEVSSAPSKAADGTITWDGVHNDITERREAEEKVVRLAFYDELTGLANRRLLLDRLSRALTSSQRKKRCGALIFMDLDNFKSFNDTFGHDVGDELLKTVATRLSKAVRATDTVSRFGGDEFVIVLDELNGNEKIAAHECSAIAEKFLTVLREAIFLAGQNRFITPSIGIVLFSDKPATIDELMKHADLAMYRAKSAGRNNYKFFDPHMQKVAHDRVTLEEDLRRAIEDDQFELHYQPQVYAGRIISLEALIRWNHPTKGLISPKDFIPLAEETGLIVPIGRKVIEAAAKQLSVWQQNPITRELVVAVNVSIRQIRQSDFVEHIKSALVESGVPFTNFKIEITETVLASNAGEILSRMNELRKIGITFALDDFGTGYSSLSYLKRFPLSTVKIDQSFVRDIHTDVNDAAIVEAVVGIGRSLNLTLIAEGVETSEQLDLLSSLGCNVYQGFLFFRPMTADQIVEAIEVQNESEGLASAFATSAAA